MNRFQSLLRMQLVDWRVALAWYVGILGAALSINVVIWAVMSPAHRGNAQTFGLVAIYIVSLITFQQSMTQLFPFAMGLSATRRTFYAALATFAVAQSLVFGLMLYVLLLAERATNGWYVDVVFFDLPFLRAGNPAAQVLVYAIPLILFAAMGAFSGSVTKRWGPNGVFGMLLGSVMVIGLLVALATWLDSWAAIWHWLTTQSAGALFAGWALLPAALLLVAGFTVVRRAVP
jgi:hypothetical protein